MDEKQQRAFVRAGLIGLQEMTLITVKAAIGMLTDAAKKEGIPEAVVVEEVRAMWDTLPVLRMGELQAERPAGRAVH